MKQQTYPITFKVIDEEMQIIKAQAQKHSLPTASFIRMFLLKSFREAQT